MIKITLTILVVTFLLFQFIRPSLDEFVYDKNLSLEMPEDIETIFKRACSDCHSDKVSYPWYSKIAPFSWIISSHIKNGRRAINFSRWKDIPRDIKIKRLKRSIQTVEIGMMPLPSYTWLHKDAVLTKKDKILLNQYFRILLEDVQRLP
jgi:hypothetical protein